MKTSCCAVIIALVLAMGCAEEPHMEDAILVSAHESYLGASVVLNGKEIGKLEHLAGHGSLFESVLKQAYGDSPALHVVAAIVSLNDQGLSPGLHEISVVAPGKLVARGPVTYPPSGEVDQYFVNGKKIEAVGAPAAPAP